MHRPRRIVAITACGIVLAACSSSTASSGSSGTGTPASPALVARTRAAHVPLLTQEGLTTHVHTTLIVKVNGKRLTVPAGIGIDEATNHIAALHTHDATGYLHIESPKENDFFTLDQFLTLWGMPADAPGRCIFFKATAPCTLSVTSKDTGPVRLDVKLADEDTLTLTVTSP